ncbi:MAG: flagellar motor switch protein FliN [Nitrospinota bacterium]
MSDEMEAGAQSEPEGAEGEVSWDDVQEELAAAKAGGGEAAEASEAEGPDASGDGAPSPDSFREEELGEQKPPANLEFILDIPLRLSVELGRTRMVISDLLKLGQGSVIELAKLVGEPLDILVNGKEIARGEVVVVNEKFGVRLTDIVNPFERVQQLR